MLELFYILSHQFLTLGFPNQLLKLRATCKDACIIINQDIFHYNRQNPINRSWYFDNVCMWCKDSQSSQSSANLHTYYQYGNQVSFCKDNSMCRMQALIYAMDLCDNENNNIHLRSNDLWFGLGPYKVLRSNGSICDGWTHTQYWFWSPEKKEISFVMQKQVDFQNMTKGCLVSDLIKLNGPVNLPPVDMLIVNGYSLGSRHINIISQILKQMKEIGMKAETHCGLPKCLENL